MSTPQLVFVYNAEAGLVQGMLDSLHKTLSPDTYECALCAITHGFFTMDKKWRAYLKALPIEAAFFHRSDFKETFPGADVELPAILIARGQEIMPLVTAPEMVKIKSVDDLCAVLDEKLAAAGLVKV